MNENIIIERPTDLVTFFSYADDNAIYLITLNHPEKYLKPINIHGDIKGLDLRINEKEREIQLQEITVDMGNRVFDGDYLKKRFNGTFTLKDKYYRQLSELARYSSISDNPAIFDAIIGILDRDLGRSYVQTGEIFEKERLTDERGKRINKDITWRYGAVPIEEEGDS